MTMISNFQFYNNIIGMKKIFITLLLLLSVISYSQTTTKINYWTWSTNHLKQEPQKWNRYDSWNYLPRYYFAPTISFTIKPFKYQKPFNYFLYRENKKAYKFIY